MEPSIENKEKRNLEIWHVYQKRKPLSHEVARRHCYYNQRDFHHLRKTATAFHTLNNQTDYPIAVGGKNKCLLQIE